MKNESEKYRVWIEAQRRHKLSDAHVQMARELGMNPKKLGGLDNHRQEPWKAPLPVFLEECYEKRFGRRRPDVVKPLMQGLREHERKKRARKEQRRLNRAQRALGAKDPGMAGAAEPAAGRAPEPERPIE